MQNVAEPQTQTLVDGGCPVCGAEGKVRQRHSRWEIRHCKWCDFAYVWPPMPPEEHREFHGPQFFKRYYSEPISEFYARKGPLYFRERAKKNWFLDFFTRYVPSGSLLDIGAGQGMFDYLARERGFEISMVELCPPVVEYHRSQGVALYEGYPEDMDFADESFNGVAMWHSLEHVFDPLKTLRQVARVLKPGGHLVGALPNWHGLGTRLRLALKHPLFDPETDHELHFSYFSARALRRAFLRAGLEPVAIGREWHRPRRLQDILIHRTGDTLSWLPGVDLRETQTFVARKPPGREPLSPRHFVIHRQDAGIPNRVKVDRMLTVGEGSAVSILIPTADGAREGYLPDLLRQLRDQDLPDFEVLVVEGDNRQGRAINTAVDMARGDILVTMDDDTRLSDPRTLSRLVQAIQSDPRIGMAGGSNQAPPDASGLVRQVMLQLPRRSSPPVEVITDSDMAEHPLLAMRKEAFIKVGGENELIPRGLDPYLREKFRQAGYRVVVAPGVVYHHMPPTRLIPLIKQFYRNGAQSRYCSSLYPEWVYETQEAHGQGPVARPSLLQRVGRQLSQMGGHLKRGHWVFVVCRVAYAAGWIRQSLRRQ